MCLQRQSTKSHALVGQSQLLSSAPLVTFLGSLYCNQYGPRSDCSQLPKGIRVHMVSMKAFSLKCPWIYAADVKKNIFRTKNSGWIRVNMQSCGDVWSLVWITRTLKIALNEECILKKTWEDKSGPSLGRGLILACINLGDDWQSLPQSMDVK